MKRARVHYTKAAERDIEAIASYTLRAWGEAQRDFYLDLLQETCERILPAHHKLARPVDGFAGLFHWRVEHHIAYFRRVGGDLEIVRILHERQLPAKQLKR